MYMPSRIITGITMYMQAITTGFGSKNTAKYGVLTYDMNNTSKILRQYSSKQVYGKKVTDLFVDSEKDLWLVTPKGIWEAKKKRYLLLPKDAGELQDVEVSNDRIYLFFSFGEVICYSQNQGKPLYRKAAYPENERTNYSRTSLVVKGPDGNFYQVRAARSPAYLSFPQSRTWRLLLETHSPLHTLIVPPTT